MPRKRKPVQMRVGAFYWEKSGGRYRLNEVTGRSGGVRRHGDAFTRGQARIFLQGVRTATRLGVGKARKIPGLR